MIETFFSGTENIQKNFNDSVARLLQNVKDYQKEAKMPSYILYTFAKGEVPYGSTSKNEYVPYDEPEATSTYFDIESGVGIAVIKAQVDFRAGKGRQYLWRAYLIGKDGGVKMVKQEGGFYEDQLKDGSVVDMNAEDIYKTIKE